MLSEKRDRYAKQLEEEFGDRIQVEGHPDWAMRLAKGIIIYCGGANASAGLKSETGLTNLSDIYRMVYPRLDYCVSQHLISPVNSRSAKDVDIVETVLQVNPKLERWAKDPYVWNTKEVLRQED